MTIQLAEGSSLATQVSKRPFNLYTAHIPLSITIAVEGELWAYPSEGAGVYPLNGGSLACHARGGGFGLLLFDDFVKTSIGSKTRIAVIVILLGRQPCDHKVDNKRAFCIACMA